MVTELESHKC